MDTNKSGKISFEEWLEFTYKHVCEKVKTAPKPAKKPFLGCFAGCSKKDEFEVAETPGETGGTQEFATQTLADELENMSRGQFIEFCRKATSEQSSKEADKLYHFLLRCFSMADNDYDGKVDVEEFDMMVELAAKDVRRLGLAPTHKQTYKSSTERKEARKALFDQVDSEKNGSIRFEQWLEYTLNHIKGKVGSAPDGEIANMNGSKEEFMRSMTILTGPRGKETAEYKEFYRFLMACFMEADSDRDGKVNLVEFDQMVEKAGAFPRSHGLAPPTWQMFKTVAERTAARKQHFEAMDKSGQGYISFEQWLDFTYDHVCKKVLELPS